MAALAAAVYAVFAYFQWIRLTTPSWDLAIFSQLAKSYAKWSPPIVPLNLDPPTLIRR
jgi:hypothetical protein